MGDAPISKREFTFLATESSGRVSALLERPADAWALLVLAHGAGAGMHHWFMEAVTKRLLDRGLAVLRYNFPYMEQGKKRPDNQPKLLKTVRSSMDAARETVGDLPILAGGKSMGGRMTSLVAAADGLGEVAGLLFFGFPLHSPAKPGSERAAHLPDVTVPMLYLQGTRDSLARLDLLEPVLAPLPLATLHVVEGADHGFHVLKRSGRTDEEVLDELAEAAVLWARRIV